MKDRKLRASAQTATENANVKIPMGIKAIYSLGDFAQASLNLWMNAFVSIFLTDFIGVEAGIVSALVLGARAFDAINDPVIGSLADRTHTRWGRYKPWVIIGGILSGFIISMFFSNNPDWPYQVKVGYAIAFYLAYTVCITSLYIPYIALTGAMTSNTEERMKLASMRGVTSNLGNSLIQFIAVPLILLFSAMPGVQDAGGYSKAVLLCCIIVVPFAVISVIPVKERLFPPASQKKLPLKRQFLALVKNPPMLMIMVGFIGMGFIAYGRTAVWLYYFTYVAGNATLFSFIGLIGIFAAVIGAGVINPLLYRKTRNKARNVTIATAASGVGLILMSFFTTSSPFWWAMVAVAAVGQAAFAAALYGMVPDAADNGELVTHVRCDGFLTSSATLGLKLGGALGPAIFVAIYAALGYAANEAQNPAVLNAMNASVSWVPGILFIVLAVIFLFYKINEARHTEIRQELERRRAAGE